MRTDSKFQVDTVVYVTVGVKILVTDLEPLYHWRVLQGDASLRSGPWGGGNSTIKDSLSGLMRVMEEFEELLEQGEALAGEGLLQDALSRFEAAGRLEPAPEVAEAMGRALLGLDRLEEAEGRFLEALALDPEWVAPRMGLAALAMRVDEPFKVVHQLERATSIDPEYPDTFVELGRYYALLGE